METSARELLPVSGDFRIGQVKTMLHQSKDRHKLDVCVLLMLVMAESAKRTYRKRHAMLPSVDRGTSSVYAP